MHERIRPSPKRLTAVGPSPSVGFLVDLLDEGPYQWAVLRGAMEAAHDRGAHLLCFAGGVLGAPRGASGERNGVFELAKPSNVDAVVILSGSVGKHIGPDGLQEYCERYRSIPMCSIGVELKDVSSVRIDNETGMRSVIEHLIGVHGMRRIAFLRGPVPNAEAEQRYRVYLETLQSNGIPFAPELVVSGDFERGSGREAINVLLSERKLPIDAIRAVVAANDSMALGALDELAKRGIRVPDQIAVVGFDDFEESRFALPPLTTVRQPLYELGHDAVCMVLDQLRNGAPPERQVRHAEPVIRRSCGCVGSTSLVSVSSDGPTPTLGFEAALIRRRQIILAEMSRAARGELSGAGPNWAERLLGAFAEEIRGESPDAFVRAYDDFLRRLASNGGDSSVSNDVVSALRARVLGCLAGDSQRHGQAEDLFHRVRIMTAQVTDRMQARLRMRAWTSARALGRAAAAIASGRGLDDLARAVAENLPPLGIARCFAAEYAGGTSEARVARLLLVEKPGGSNSDWTRSATFPAVDILRRAVLPTAGGHAFAVLPITHRDKELGILVLELGAAEGYLYETLREVFTAVLSREHAPD
jgi:phosphoserine phosphatase RsbU/P